MNKQFRIRKAVLEDTSALQNCMEAAYAPYQDRIGGKRLPPMDLDYQDEIQNYPTWIAEFNGNIVGGLIMMFNNVYATIANIAVHPDFQGQGLGGELMAYAEAIARAQNYSELHLMTHIQLTENISLYRHLGWTEIDRSDVRINMKKDI